MLCACALGRTVTNTLLLTPLPAWDSSLDGARPADMVVDLVLQMGMITHAQLRLRTRNTARIWKFTGIARAHTALLTNQIVGLF